MLIFNDIPSVGAKIVATDDCVRQVLTLMPFGRSVGPEYWDMLAVGWPSIQGLSERCAGKNFGIQLPLRIRDLTSYSILPMLVICPQQGQACCGMIAGRFLIFIDVTE